MNNSYYLLDFLTQLELEVPMDPAITDEYTMGYRTGFNEALEKIRKEDERTGFLRIAKAFIEKWDKL